MDLMSVDFIHEIEDLRPLSRFQCLVRENAVESRAEILIIALHILMLECGYVLYGDHDSRRPQKDHILLASRMTKSSYKLQYKNITYPDVQFTLVCVVMNSTLVVHGIDEFSGTAELSLKIEKFVNTSTGELQQCRKLSQRFKDELALKKLHLIMQAKNENYQSPLEALPTEIKLYILMKCSYKDIVALGQTCKTFNDTYRDEAIWEKLFKQNYSENTTANTNICTWYEKFQKHHRIARRSMSSRPITFTYRLPPSPPTIQFEDRDEEIPPYSLSSLDWTFGLRHAERRRRNAHDLARPYLDELAFL